MEPDLFFLDIQMPKLDGFEVLELIGANRAVVFVTAYDDFCDSRVRSSRGRYFLKPISADASTPR